jgi:hypothetical protein
MWTYHTQTSNYRSFKPTTLEPSNAMHELALALCVVTGNVTYGANSLPLKGAHVALIGDSTYTAQTDAHGSYKLTAPVGSYTFEAKAAKTMVLNRTRRGNRTYCRRPGN